jgi:hypothetical protein
MKLRKIQQKYFKTKNDEHFKKNFKLPAWAENKLKIP